MRRKFHLLKFPWGNPREAQPGPKAQSNQAWSIPPRGDNIAVLIDVARAPPPAKADVTSTVATKERHETVFLFVNASDRRR
jgi:hypothetical protein